MALIESGSGPSPCRAAGSPAARSPSGSSVGRSPAGRPAIRSERRQASPARPGSRACPGPARLGAASSAGRAEERFQRDVEKNRAAMPGGGQPECLADRPAHPAGLVLGPGPLGDRRQQLRVIDLLQAPRAPPVVGRAAAEHHHRGSVEVRRRDRADAVGDPRAGGENGEPRHPAEPGGRLCREDRRLLVPDVDDAHRRICPDRAVVKREDMTAGQREHGRCATSACGGHRLRTPVHGSLAGAARLILAGAARRSLASAAGRCQPRFALVLPFRLAHARDVISRAAGGRRCSRPRPGAAW